MLLLDVYEDQNSAQILYDLLKERDETININHRSLPSWSDHVRYIESHPYEAWYLIEVDGAIVGACNLTVDNELGVFIFEAHQGHGYGPQALKLLMAKHGNRKYIANINPKNQKSAATFAKLGFRPVYTVNEYEYGVTG